MRFTRRGPALLAGLMILVAAAGARAESLVPLAQANMPHPAEPYAVWIIRCLGLFGLLTLLSALALFLGACLVVVLARRPAVIAAYLVFLPLPLWFAAIAMLKSNVSAFSVLAVTGVQLKNSQICAGLAESIIPVLAALMATLPSYLVIAFGLFIRTLLANKRPL